MKVQMLFYSQLPHRLVMKETESRWLLTFDQCWQVSFPTQLGINQLYVVDNPYNKMIFEGLFDDLVEEVRRERFMNICMRKIMSEWLDTLCQYWKYITDVEDATMILSTIL